MNGSSAQTAIGGRAARCKTNFQKLIQLHKTSVTPSSYVKKDNMRNITSVQQLALNNVEIPHQDDIVEMPEIRESDAIRFDIEKIRADVRNLLQLRQELQTKITECKTTEQQCIDSLPQLQNEKKLKERTQLLLENPEENLVKLAKILQTAPERMKKLQDQWDEHRRPLEQQIQTTQQNNAQYVSGWFIHSTFGGISDPILFVLFFFFILFINAQSHTKKIMEHIKATKSETEELAGKLKRKVALHARLVDEFEKNNRNINR